MWNPNYPDQMYTMKKKHELWFGPWCGFSGVKRPLEKPDEMWEGILDSCNVWEANLTLMDQQWEELPLKAAQKASPCSARQGGLSQKTSVFGEKSLECTWPSVKPSSQSEPVNPHQTRSIIAFTKWQSTSHCYVWTFTNYAWCIKKIKNKKKLIKTSGSIFYQPGRH